jgi:hypothetical protein
MTDTDTASQPSVQSEMRPIPFTQYVLPRGFKKAVAVNRPAAIADMAERFLAAGGRYECEVLTTGEVSLTAVMNVDDEPQDVEIEICPNGPAVMDATDRLIAASLKHIGGA